MHRQRFLETLKIFALGFCGVGGLTVMVIGIIHYVRTAELADGICVVLLGITGVSVSVSGLYIYAEEARERRARQNGFDNAILSGKIKI